MKRHPQDWLHCVEAALGLDECPEPATYLWVQRAHPCNVQVHLWDVPPCKSARPSARPAAPELVPGVHGAGIHPAAPPPLHCARRDLWAHLQIQDAVLSCKLPHTGGRPQRPPPQQAFAHTVVTLYPSCRCVLYRLGCQLLK